MSLKLTSLMVHPPLQLIQALTQFKHLSKYSKLKNTEVDIVNTEVSVELFIDLESGSNAVDYENNHNRFSSASVCIRAVISMVSFEQTRSTLPIHTEITECNNDCRVLLNLASITANFSPTGHTSRNNLNKNATTQGANDSLNKNYLVRVLNPKLSRITQQGTMMAMMLDSISKQYSDTIDFGM